MDDMISPVGVKVKNIAELQKRGDLTRGSAKRSAGKGISGTELCQGKF
jgi:hypothetical protein